MTFEIPVQVRFRDIDALGHVNNAVLVTYLEYARWHWWQTVLKGTKFESEGFLIARIEVDYQNPILLDADLRVGVSLKKIGHKSFTLHYHVRDHTTKMDLASATTVQVMFDFQEHKSKPISSQVRQCLEVLPLFSSE